MLVLRQRQQDMSAERAAKWHAAALLTLPQPLVGLSSICLVSLTSGACPSARPQVQFLHALRPAVPTSQSSFLAASQGAGRREVEKGRWGGWGGTRALGWVRGCDRMEDGGAD